MTVTVNKRSQFTGFTDAQAASLITNLALANNGFLGFDAELR